MRVTETERAFLHELHAVKKDPLGKRIIHFCASAAPPAPGMSDRVAKAARYIERSFSKSPYCKVFPAHNNDLFVTYSHVTVSEVLGVCAKVEKLFMGDEPFAKRNPYGEYAFYKIADASKDIEPVFHTFKAMLAGAQPDPEAALKRPMTAENLEFLGGKMHNMDLRHCIFNQPVYFVGDKVPSIEFLEFFVSSRQIETNFLPSASLAASPWLFHALREDFDRVVLRTMAREIPEYRHKAFSLNVTLATALSQDFAEFHGSLPSRIAGRIVLEVHKTDVVQHLGLYKKARRLTADKGLKLCIDGLDWHDFDVLAPARLKPDYVKVSWSEDMLAADREELQSLVNGVKALNQHGRVVLARCDSPKAFPFARSMGVDLVQGRLADQFFKSGMQLH